MNYSIVGFDEIPHRVVCEAYHRWATNEGKFRIELISISKSKNLRAEELEKFLKKFCRNWFLQNTLYRSQNGKIKPGEWFINKKIFQRLSESDSVDIVKEITESMKDEGISGRVKLKDGTYKHTIQTSFISKIMTLYNPDRFSPYDRYVRESLRDFNKINNLTDIADHDYEEFCRSFNLIEELLKDNINNCISISEKCPCICEIKKNNKDWKSLYRVEWLRRRILDKHLMVLAGFEL